MKNTAFIRSIFLAGIFTLFVLPGYSAQIDVRDLPSFKALDASGSVDVILKKGEKEEARIEVDQIDVERVITKVENGTLHIYLKENMNFGSRGRIVVYVSYKKLASVTSTGSGDILCKTLLDSENIKIKSSGSGDVKLHGLEAKESIQITTRGSGDVFIQKAKAKALSAKLSGSGDLRIDKGSSNTISFGSSGSGDISAGGLIGESVDASTSGSGDIKTHCTGALNVRISGSGDVAYYGSPSSKNVNKSGSGDARGI